MDGFEVDDVLQTCAVGSLLASRMLLFGVMSFEMYFD